MNIVGRDALRGLGAGAAGTVTLNIITYADMALRGRPSSSTPQQIAANLARRLGLLPRPMCPVAICQRRSTVRRPSAR